MEPASTNKAIITLSRTFGIEPEYTDARGRPHRTSLNTARRILEAKGVFLDTENLPGRPSTLVIADGELPESYCFPVKPPPGSDGSAPLVEGVVIQTVDHPGEVRSFSYESSQVTIHERDEVGLLWLSVPFPADLPEGTYQVQVATRFEGDTDQLDTRWKVCPSKAHLPAVLDNGRKISGVAIALYGVRSANNWGVGDFSDLRKIIDWAADGLGVDLVGLNPLHALFNRAPYNISPYMPSSRLFRNIVYLDVPGMDHFQESPEARAFVDGPDIRALIQRLRAEETVNYEETSALKLQVLRRVFQSFMDRNRGGGNGGAQWSQFRSYIAVEGDYLEKFATFCALDEHFRAQSPPVYLWKEWPATLRDPEGPDVREFRQQHPDDILFWQYVQWQLDSQLEGAQQYAEKKGMLVGLYHDQALAVDQNGADAWAMQQFFHHGFTVGAPPDPFAPKGQNWGFAPPNSEGLRSADYEPFLRLLKANCRHGGALRIDHVMQFCRLFWIPQDRPASEGVYVKDFEEDLVNLLVHESRRNGTLIVGEDLGTVPLDFRERLMRKGIFSYRLYYFERDSQGDPVPHFTYPENALVSISTHDLPTLAGFWSAADIDLRRAVGQLGEEDERLTREERTDHKAKIIKTLVDHGFLPAHTAHEAWMSPFPTEHLHAAIISFLLSTPSKLAVINQEDIFLDTRQQNLPATTWENPNWVTKMRYSVEELQSDPQAVRLTERFRNLARTHNRSIERR